MTGSSTNGPVFGNARMIEAHCFIRMPGPRPAASHGAVWSLGWVVRGGSRRGWGHRVGRSRLIVGLREPLLELGERLAKRSRQLGQLLRPEEKDHKTQRHPEVLGTNH